MAESKETRVDLDRDEVEGRVRAPKTDVNKTFLDGPQTKRLVPMSETYMDQGVDPDATVGPEDEEPEGDETFGPDSEATVTIDPVAGEATMGPTDDDLDATLGPDDEEDLRLANTFMPEGEADPAGEETLPEMTFMAPGGDGDDLEPEMTFMAPGGDGDDLAPEMTFMQAGEDPQEGAEPEMTFMQAGPKGGGSLPAPSGDMQTVTDLNEESDVTFVSMGSQEDVAIAGATASGSRSGSGSGSTAGARSTGGLSQGGRSRTALRTNRLEADKVVAKIRGDAVEEELYAGTYKLLGELARGGMGAVYKALHVNLNEVRALKVMLAGAHASDDARRRFMFEAEACARLKHPHILAVNDIGEVDGNLYFTMPFVKGSDLKERKGDLTREELLEVMIKTCRGVAHAHQKGIIHRDLKPANVMMTVEGEPLVMDFGLAKQIEDVDKEDEDLAETELSRTTEGSIMGTPYYMSPEQAQGKIHEVDTRTDVYALGVMLYELWAKKLPFKARSAAKILQMIVNDEPERPRSIDETIDPDLEAIVLKAIDKNPDKRYATAHDLEEDLVRYRDGEVVSAQRATIPYRLKKWLKKNRQQVVVGVGIVLLLVGSIVALVAQNIAQKREVEQQIQSQIATARAGISSQDEKLKALGAQVAALLAAKTESGDRSVTLAAQSLAAKEILAALEEAGSPLGAHRQSHLEAEATFQAFDEHRRKVLGYQQTLARLSEGTQHAARAQSVVTELAPHEPRAKAALAVGASVKLEVKDLAASTARARAILDKKGATAPVSSAYQTEREAMEAKLSEVRREVYACLSQLPQHAPEAAAARRLLAQAEETLRRVDQEVELAESKNRARVLLSSAESMVEVLDAQPDLKVRDDEARVARFEAGRLARSLATEALKHARVDGREEVLLGVNRAYCQALLTMRAYQAFELELRDPKALRSFARKKLLSDLEELLARRQELLKKLEGAELRLKLTRGKVKIRSGGSINPMVLLGGMSKLKALRKARTDPLMDKELESLRQSRLNDVKTTIATLGEQLVEEQLEFLFNAQVRFDHEDLDKDGKPSVSGDLKALAKLKLISRSLGRGSVIAYKFKLIRGADPTRWVVTAAPNPMIAMGLGQKKGDPAPPEGKSTRLLHYALNQDGQAFSDTKTLRVDATTCAISGGKPVFEKLVAPARPAPKKPAPAKTPEPKKATPEKAAPPKKAASKKPEPKKPAPAKTPEPKKTEPTPVKKPEPKKPEPAPVKKPEPKPEPKKPEPKPEPKEWRLGD